MEENNNKRVDEILNSWNGAQRASVTPFLHTRVMARLEKSRAKTGFIPSLLARPAVAFAMIIGVLAVNAWLLFGTSSEKGVTANDSEQTVSALVNDYSLENTYTLADINE
jgi:hypothetical protein